MVPGALRTAVEQIIASPVTATQPIGGGSINSAAQLQTETSSYFLKWNDAAQFPGMFEAEAKGLQLLAAHSAFTVPEVLAQGIAEGHSFLLLEFLERGYTKWKDAGVALAKMHRQTADQFGLDHDNYIGSLPQRNTRHASWKEFFANERIFPQLKMAIDRQRLTKNDLRAAENFCSRIDELFPVEAPALLHGDLWIGNFMFTTRGPSIFDPAVYYGHREMDIAMSRLFGGFAPDFYDAYHAEFPLGKNWEQRMDYCNLYPLLVHVNLFDGGYVQQARVLLQPFA